MVVDARLERLYDHGSCVTEAVDDPRFGMVHRGAEARQLNTALAAELWKTVCSDCPVWRTCLDYAVDKHEVGIWSGTTDWQRVVIRDRRSARDFDAQQRDEQAS